MPCSRRTPMLQSICSASHSGSIWVFGVSTISTESPHGSPMYLEGGCPSAITDISEWLRDIWLFLLKTLRQYPSSTCTADRNHDYGPVSRGGGALLEVSGAPQARRIRARSAPYPGGEEVGSRNEDFQACCRYQHSRKLASVSARRKAGGDAPAGFGRVRTEINWARFVAGEH